MTLQNLRRRAAFIVALVSVVLGVVGPALEWMVNGGFGPATILSGIGVAALLATFLGARDTQMFRYTAVSVLMAEVMALLIAARGQVWQIDLHMVFFAALALCALMYDVRAIVLGTVLVAVHHLALGLGMDTLVFYGGGGLPRIVLHAVVLLVEAGGLSLAAINVVKLLGVAESKSAEADAEAAKVRELATANEGERLNREADHRQMLETLQGAFGTVVGKAADGKFDGRVPENFADPMLNDLAHGVNGLVSSLAHGFDDMVATLGRLANADLTARMSASHVGAFGLVQQDVNRLAEKFASVVTQLKETSSQLKTATSEILSGANDLADRTTKQAAAIEETTAAIEQLSNTVTENARRAEDASSMSRNVSVTAEKTGDVMEKSNAAMERISTSSSKISNIIGMIDDIAFQTNLLALNASVEAARAGDAGKGFAVVAVEVRRLAQSAAQASNEVKALIEQSATEVVAGSKLVAEATESLMAMVGSVKESATLIKDIASASQEQAASIGQVTAAIRQMDEMTQHNAALVQETNAAIEQTENQANDLDMIVDQFVVAGTERAVATAKPSRPVARPADPAPKRAPAKMGIKALQSKVAASARTYLGGGATAAKDDEWAEF